MTREEAKEILTHNWTRVDNPNYSESELDEAFFMAIEALEELPKRRKEAKRWKSKALQAGSTVSEDCISRQEAIHHVCVECEPIIRSLSPAKKKGIEALQAKPKHGKWEDRISCQVDEDAYHVANCSECKAEITIDPNYDSYCPNCGAKMDGGKEREVEE